MSLRTDITSAYDEIAPPAPALKSQIRVVVAAETRAAASSRPTLSRWISGLRGTAALVAAVLIVLLVATVFVGGRVWQDWHAFTHRPAPAGPINTAQQLALLEAQPLYLPAVKAGGACPETPINQQGDVFAGLYGAGPVYLAGGSAVSDAWGVYWYLAAVTRAQDKGLVVIRGRDLQTGQPVIFVGNWASGPVVGADTVNDKLDQQHVELVLDGHHPPPNTIQFGTVTWGFTAGLAAGASGCTGWQIDTIGSGPEIIVTRQIPG